MLAVISGGSQGLGYALAEKYIEQGYEVYIVARTQSKLAEAAKRLDCKYIQADVSEPREATRVFKELGRVPDLVICCAGAAHPGLFLDISTDDLAKNLNTVYNTTVYFAHAALKVMSTADDRHSNRRHLIMCSSMVSVFPFIGYSAYAPAKAAIRSLSDIIRQECLEHNIRVSHLLPGSMDTEGYANEQSIKPEIVKKIEGPSPAIPASEAADVIVRALSRGEDTVYTDTISWVLGTMMLGTSPRIGYGFVQSVVGILLVIFGPVVRWFIDRDVRKSHK